MKNLFLLLIAFVPGFYLQAQFSFNGVVAHRGGIYNDLKIPENSIAALNESIRFGVYAAEIDVHLTKDNVPIVFHDHEHAGMNVETSNYLDLSAVKLSNGETIPTLDQYIKATLKDPRINLWLDLKRSKVSKARDVLLAQFTGDIIKHNHAEKRMEVITPSFDALVKIKQLVPEVKLYYIGVDKSPGTLKLLGFDGINLQFKRYDNGEYNIKEAQKYGLIIGSYVVDDPKEMIRQLDQGVNFITTNKPAVLIEVLKTYKRAN